MSLLHPGIDTRHIIQQEALKASGLRKLGAETDKAFINNMSDKEYNAWLKKLQASYVTPKEWTGIDDDLTKLGYRVDYSKENNKVLSRFNSNFAQTKINRGQIGAQDEKALLSGITEITENMDLSNTTIDSLGTIRKIGGSLYLDTTSPIRDLSSLKEIGGSIVVRGRSTNEIEDFLKKANFPLDTLGKKIRTIIKCL